MRRTLDVHNVLALWLTTLQVGKTHRELVEEICKNKTLGMQPSQSFHRKFKIHSREDWPNENPSFERNAEVFYTDGSETK